MTNEEIVKVLRGIAMDVFRTCEGCDLEENCSVRGCAILMAAADAMENLQTETAALRRVVDNILNEQAMMIKEFTDKLEELAEVNAERDAAVSDLNEIMYKGGYNIDTCEYCKSGICYGRNGPVYVSQSGAARRRRRELWSYIISAQSVFCPESCGTA